MAGAHLEQKIGPGFVDGSTSTQQVSAAPRLKTLCHSSFQPLGRVLGRPSEILNAQDLRSRKLHKV